MKILLSTIFSISILLFAQAQSDFVSTSSGDTIYGKIGFESPSDISESISIKNDNGKQTIYSNKILVIQANGKTYRSIRHGNKYRLMQEIVPGYLSLLKYREDGYQFSTNFLHKATGDGIAISPISFRRSVSGFLEECKELSAAVFEKEYGFKNVEEVVKKYNSTCLREIPQLEAPELDLNEFQILLSDIMSKQNKNEPVPEYLKKALKEYADQDITSALLQLLESLDN